LFVHIFAHRSLAYAFESCQETEDDAGDWMSRHFFTGGIMPSDDLLLHFQEDVFLQQRWSVSGTHYARTLEAWLLNCDRYRHDLLQLFKADLGDREGSRQLQRWRMFFMACAELFNYRHGEEWFVAHYLFGKR